MTLSGDIYEFTFRGFLAEEALDRAGRQHPNLLGAPDEEISKRVGLDALDEAAVTNSRGMATVYLAVCAFENSVRKFITTTLLEKAGTDWWDKSASQGIKKKVEGRQKDEERIRWHSGRGTAPITYTDMSDLGLMIRNNWQHFDPPVPSIEWASNILDIIERSRNVIMHGGVLGKEDVERIGINIRDWVKQIGV
jgi:hypothetical protein